MKRTKYAKLFFGTLVVSFALVVVLILSSFCSAHEPVSAPDEIDCQEVKSLGLSSGALKLIGESKDAGGNTVQKLCDDRYTYFFDPAKREVRVIIANDDVMEKIVDDASGLSMQLVPAADNDIMNVIRKFFPEYDLDAVKVDVDTESGSPIEFFQYTIREYKDDVQINKAQISISIDGQVTFVHGSHNRIGESEDYSKISSSDAIDIAFSYLTKAKSEYEEKMNPHLDEASAEEYIIATEDMLLPDGVKVGDTFKPEKLPAYKIFLDGKNDMNVIRNEKLMYGDTVAWLVEFTVRTSWGEYDSIFDPLIHIYVDASTGDVLEMNMTDGG